MVGINPGDLRDVVAFYSLTRVANNNGGSNPSWKLAFKTFAKVTNEKPNRSIESGQLVSITTRKLIVRYSANREIASDMKVQCQGVDYLIVSIDDVDTTKMLVALTVTRS